MVTIIFHYYLSPNSQIYKSLNLSFEYDEDFKDFEKLQYVFFSQLQILKIQRTRPIYIKFLEKNGRNLKGLYVGDIYGYSGNSLNLTIATKLRKLSTGFKNDELETLKMVFNGCKHLESITIWCGGKFFSEKEAFEAFAKYS